MTKPTKERVGPVAQASEPAAGKRRRRRLERQIAKLRDVEEKRARQLDEARKRRATLESRLAALEPHAGDEPGQDVPATSTTSDGPQAYCLREHLLVAMADPRPIVMRNGRPAIAGTCPSCGAKVVTTARASLPGETPAGS
jgi:hypothetical protein